MDMVYIAATVQMDLSIRTHPHTQDGLRPLRATAEPNWLNVMSDSKGSVKKMSDR